MTSWVHRSGHRTSLPCRWAAASTWTRNVGAMQAQGGGRPDAHDNLVDRDAAFRRAWTQALLDDGGANRAGLNPANVRTLEVVTETVVAAVEHVLGVDTE